MEDKLNSSNQARYTSELSKLRQKTMRDLYGSIRTSLQSNDHGDVSFSMESDGFKCYNKCLVLSIAPGLFNFVSAGKEGSIPEDEIDETLKNRLAAFYQPDHIASGYEEMFNELEKMFQNDTYSDVTLEMSDCKTFNCHRCILAAHSEYFNSMFYSQWKESHEKNIKMNNISSNVFEVFLNYIYAGKVDAPADIDVLDLILAQDLILMKSFHEVIKLHIKAYYCHYFHSPCDSCIVRLTTFYSLMLNTNLLGYSDLLESCDKWFVRYYQKIFQNRNFLKIPKQVREIIVSKVNESVDHINILPNLHEISQLRSRLPNVKWALESTKYVKLIECYCLKYACDNLKGISSTAGFKVCLLEDTNIHKNKLVMEMFENAINTYLTKENCLMVYKTASQLNNELTKRLMVKELGRSIDLEHSKEFIDSILKSAKTFVKKNFFQLQRTENWKDLEEPLKQELLKDSGFL